MRCRLLALLLLSRPLAVSASTQTAQGTIHPGGRCPEYLLGCPIDPDPDPDGSAYGGQQPVVGSQIYLLQASPSGYGAASVSVMNHTAQTYLDISGGPTDDFYFVLSDSTGSFTLTGNYTCTVGSLVYAYAMGGDAGAGYNSAIGELAILGTCPASGSFSSTVPYVSMSEVTTIAAAYSLAGFAVDATHVGSPNTTLALAGIKNAFQTSSNLVDLFTGTALTTTPAGNGAVPQLLLNSLADILAACIGSSGSTSSACSTLLSTATADGTSTGTQPTDTAIAAINIAHYPAANISTLFGLIPSSPAYTGLSSQPNDFTVAITFGGSGGCNSCGGPPEPKGIAVDAAGNVWVTNTSVGGSNTFAQEFSSLGTVVTTSAGPSSTYVPQGVAIDGSGNAWVSSTYGSPISPNSAIVQITSSGSTGTSLTGGGLSGPLSITFDASGSIWASNKYIDSVSEFYSTGFTGFPYGDLNSALTGASGIAADSSGNIWVTANTNAVKLSSSGAVLYNVGVTSSTGGGLYATAVDSAGSVWVPNASNNTVTKISSAGSVLSGTGGYTGGGLNTPHSVAIVGAGSVWVASPGIYGSSAGTVTQFSSTGTVLSGTSGFQPSVNSDAQQIAIDGSGNAWVASAYSLTEIVGVATPVVTPLATAAANSTLGSRP